MLNFQELWNATISKDHRPREPHERDYVYASELGGSMIDRYYKMLGETPTNPPNERSYRKFFSGSSWEDIVKEVLILSGLKFTQQDRISLEYPDLLRVSGKIDFIVNGYEKREDDNSALHETTQALISEVEKYAQEENIKDTILEIKSVGSYVMEELEETDNPKTHHMLQAFAYRKATGLSSSVVYVCRDDARVRQYSIDDISEELEGMLLEDLAEITYFYKNKVEPPKEKLILWGGKKFKKNWKVEYSPYLTKLYSYRNEELLDGEGNPANTPFERPDQYYDWSAAKCAAWNRVVTRIKSYVLLTEDNLNHIKDMEEMGHNIWGLLGIDSLEYKITSLKTDAERKAQKKLDKEKNKQ